MANQNFSLLIEGLRYKPHSSFINKLDKGFFPFDQNKVYNYRPGYLGAEEYKRCLELFEKRFGHSTPPAEGLMFTEGILYQISKLEEPIREELQNIAVDVIRDIYNVPQHVDLKAIISPWIHLDTEENQDDNPEEYLTLSAAEKREMWEEIQKRIILNGLVHGSAMHVWKGVHHLVSEKINQLNPVLLELYDQYTSIIGLALWNMNVDMMEAMADDNMHTTQGFNEIKFNEPGKAPATVLCHAVNFPVMLHELNKGVIDYLICRGIPKEYSEKQLKYYYSKADSYKNEIWHYTLSPTLWSDLLAAADTDNHNLPSIIAGLTRLSYKELSELFRIILDDKEKGKQKLKDLKLI